MLHCMQTVHMVFCLIGATVLSDKCTSRTLQVCAYNHQYQAAARVGIACQSHSMKGMCYDPAAAVMPSNAESCSWQQSCVNKAALRQALQAMVMPSQALQHA